MPPTIITLYRSLPMAPQVLEVVYQFRVVDSEAVLVDIDHLNPAYHLARGYYLQHEATLQHEAVRASHYSTPVPPAVIPTP